MKIEGIIWLPEIVDKLNWKHHVYLEKIYILLLDALRQGDILLSSLFTN